MRIAIYAPSRSPLARRDLRTCSDWCGARGWDVIQVCGTLDAAAHAIRPGPDGAEVVVVARNLHRKQVAAMGLPVLQATREPSRAPAAALPLIWLGDRMREHPVVAAALAGTVAGVVTWWLLPDPELDRMLLPPPTLPPVVASPSPSPSASPPPSPSDAPISHPPAAGPAPSPDPTRGAPAPPDDVPAEPPPAPPPPAGSSRPSNRPPEQLPTPTPEAICLVRLDLLDIHLSVCLPLDPEPG